MVFDLIQWGGLIVAIVLLIISHFHLRNIERLKAKWTIIVPKYATLIMGEQTESIENLYLTGGSVIQHASEQIAKIQHEASRP